MDYIQEELERQRLALEALLRTPESRQAEKQPEEERRVVRRAVAGEAAEAGRPAPRRAAKDLAAAVWDGGAVLRPGENAFRLTVGEVSRTVERDARRYDGGYQMY